LSIVTSIICPLITVTIIPKIRKDKPNKAKRRTVEFTVGVGCHFFKNKVYNIPFYSYSLIKLNIYL
jgi:hypothetical protein